MRAFDFRFRSRELPINVADWRLAARRKLPDMAWSYLEGGADDLVTCQANTSGYGGYRLCMRSLAGISMPRIEATVAGTDLAMPLALAPVGATGIAHWTGDIAAARAAEACGTRAVLSTAASYLLEDVAEATDASHWFQLHPIGGRERMSELMSRAHAAGYSALFVTVDIPTLGNREGERKWHFQLPWTVTPQRAFHLARHAGWVWQALRHKRMAAVHFLEAVGNEAPANGKPGGAMAAATTSSSKLVSQIRPDLSWDDLRWLRDRWKGPFYVKGILHAEDAVKAVCEIGADGVVVSNHGGRQLDRCLASIEALPAIARALAGRGDIYLDGGIRRGTDVITALCLGAKAVFIGRPFLYGLAAAGQDGVRSVLEIFRDEMVRDLTLMGCPSVEALGPDWLARPDHAGTR